jgi:NADH dehydrogenase
VNACIGAHVHSVAGQRQKVEIAIVGAGATGVELAAELRKATRKLISYGLEGIDAERDIVLTLIEAGPRILPALPERIGLAAQRILVDQGVNVRTGARVTKVTADSVHLADGGIVAASLVVWAAGVKAPGFLQDLAGLESNRLNQLVVRSTLQTTRDDSIFAIGDCAAAPWTERSTTVPPRAQAAHQQATHLFRQLQRRLSGRPLEDWSYRDFGSLVSLGEYSTVGNLMGALLGRSIWVEGLFARAMYLSLYKLHELAVHGWWKTVVGTAARVATQSTEPRIKLH